MNAAPKQRVFRNEASKPKYFMPDEMIWLFEGKLLLENTAGH
jgi:hypothetical protein